MSDHNMTERIQTITIASSGVVSSSFTIQSHEVFIGVVFPAMDDGIIGLQYSIDSGTTYIPILDASDGEDLVVVASGADPGVIDISDYLRFAHSNAEHRIRFTCASQTSGAVKITLLTRG